MITMRVSRKGWVVIPAPLREKYKIRPGDEVAILHYGGVLSIVPLPGDPIKVGYGMLEGGRSLTEVLLEEQAKEQPTEG